MALLCHFLRVCVPTKVFLRGGKFSIIISKSFFKYVNTCVYLTTLSTDRRKISHFSTGKLNFRLEKLFCYNAENHQQVGFFKYVNTCVFLTSLSQTWLIYVFPKGAGNFRTTGQLLALNRVHLYTILRFLNRKKYKEWAHFVVILRSKYYTSTFA